MTRMQKAFLHIFNPFWSIWELTFQKYTLNVDNFSCMLILKLTFSLWQNAPKSVRVKTSKNVFIKCFCYKLVLLKKSYLWTVLVYNTFEGALKPKCGRNHSTYKENAFVHKYVLDFYSLLISDHNVKISPPYSIHCRHFLWYIQLNIPEFNNQKSYTRMCFWVFKCLFNS